MDRLETMATFVRVVETGSLSATARALDTSLPSVSRQIAALERRLDARLLTRTTRRITLTETGRSYYERVKRILGDIEEADLHAARQHSVPAGRLVVSAPVLLGRLYVATVLPDFLRRYPDVQVTLGLRDRLVNLIDEQVDVAIRVGEPAESRLVVRRLGGFSRIVCAAPAYLAARGAPRHPRELSDHACLSFTHLVEADEWVFRSGDESVSVAVNGPLRSDNLDSIIEAAVRGTGIALLPPWAVREHLRSGRLRRILVPYRQRPTTVNAVFPHSRLLSGKTRAFIDHLVAAWKKEDFDSIPSPPRRQKQGDA
jgi:DNA-binding transcriptional LysR family regulator